MARLTWDKESQRLYETGTSHGVLYTRDNSEPDPKWTGVAWNGLSAVKQAPDGAEETAVYANNHKYLGLLSAENFKGSIEAYMYPKEFQRCDGSYEIARGVYAGQQVRETFGLVYRTIIGNDVKYENYGYNLHIIYNAKVSPTSKDYETINETPNAILFTWEFATTPPELTSDVIRPTAYFKVNSTEIEATKLAALNTKLYGGEATEAELPTVAELLELLADE